MSHCTGQVPTITEATFYTASPVLQYVFVDFSCSQLQSDINNYASFEYVTQLSEPGGIYTGGNDATVNCFTSTEQVVLSDIVPTSGTWCLGIINTASSSVTVPGGVSQTCNDYYSYSAGSWSSCTSGQTTQTRTINCVDPTGATVDSKYCAGLTPPASSLECSFSYVPGSWSSCSTAPRPAATPVRTVAATP